jgi:hypothetical protein
MKIDLREIDLEFIFKIVLLIGTIYLLFSCACNKNIKEKFGDLQSNKPVTLEIYVGTQPAPLVPVSIDLLNDTYKNLLWTELTDAIIQAYHNSTSKGNAPGVAPDTSVLNYFSLFYPNKLSIALALEMINSKPQDVVSNKPVIFVAKADLPKVIGNNLIMDPKSNTIIKVPDDDRRDLKTNKVNNVDNTFSLYIDDSDPNDKTTNRELSIPYNKKGKIVASDVRLLFNSMSSMFYTGYMGNDNIDDNININISTKNFNKAMFVKPITFTSAKAIELLEKTPQYSNIQNKKDYVQFYTFSDKGNINDTNTIISNILTNSI